MATTGGGGGRALAPPHGPACPPEWHHFFGSLVSLLCQMDAQANALSVEHQRLLTEIDFLKREQSKRLEIAQYDAQQIRSYAERTIASRDQLAEILGHKEPEAFEGLGDNSLECFTKLISTLVDENTKLKKKLKEVESQAELAENNVNHQHSAKDSKAQIKKLKEAYKKMVSEKDKEISALRAERNFAWNQFNTMDTEYRETCKKKSIEAKHATEEAKHATELAEKIKQVVHEKDDEIRRLRAEVASTRENMLILEGELEQVRSLVKSKYAETDQILTSQTSKKDLNETNRKSKLEGPVLREKSRISQVTPVRREVKSSRKCVSSAKGTHNQSGSKSRMHNTEKRGQSETSQKRKRGSSSLHLRMWSLLGSSALFRKAASQICRVTHAFYPLFHYSQADCPDSSSALMAL
ncbi:hypothetical protein EJB05_56746 [Eragrostis curvula]|uniref:Uncharacterized protein n=1 Tax=Eragrostis curvula TaxID=38414 RepID=A0A5J9SI66_9POAL|nr:hypothetical protein EJB05_56746 [Eragrostis curvula]